MTAPLFRSECGVLLHPTSLPGPFGIGELGPDALRWLDALHAMGQSLWQVLPLGPTAFGDSPYQSPSTFAGNPLLLSLERLWEDGLVDRAGLASFPFFLPERVEFGQVIAARWSCLEDVATSFDARASAALRVSFAEYRHRHTSWLDNWALFSALQRAQSGRAWTEWPRELRDREPAALARLSSDLSCEIDAARVLQFLFDKQWAAIRAAARELGIQLVGDIPIFVAHDSADVWANRELFELDPSGTPQVVAGVPPDYFSETGQRWGNPLYRWAAHRERGYDWWCARVRRVLDWVDYVRIDHFRAFSEYWEIPASEPTAVNGEWRPGPGAELFEALARDLGSLPIIAEDLGLITEDVVKLRDDVGLPGMRILQFAFGHPPDDPEADNDPFLPHNYVANCVAYTGTHDNDTLNGWLCGTTDDDTRTVEQRSFERQRVQAYLRCSKDDVTWGALRALLDSPAGAVLYPMQDLLGLGSPSRMNAPGRADGNWAWRFRWDQLAPEIRDRLRAMTQASGRGRFAATRLRAAPEGED